MLEAYGLKTHIWNNNLRSTFLLIAFPLLLLVLAYGIILLFFGFTSDGNVDEGLRLAANSLPTAIPVTLGLAGGWFAIAFFGHQKIISASVKSRALTQSEEPRAYNMLENLCISRGMTMPRLNVIETEQMNAFASGIRESNYQITLTRGLMNHLDDAELNAVIAHELSHIRHKDVRMLVIAIIFVGIFAFVGEGVVRGMFRTNLGRTDHHRRSGGGNAGALIFFGIILIAVAYLFAMLIRFTLSRKREYMADAGAVELTKDPDAMIRALEKISGKAALHHVPDEIREMALHNPKVGLAGAFATHPPIEKRIDAIVKFGGGRRNTRSAPRSRMSQAMSPSNSKAAKLRKNPLSPWQR
jgi:heat shock protein HtpX